jgi:hypothetical protein
VLAGLPHEEHSTLYLVNGSGDPDVRKGMLGLEESSTRQNSYQCISSLPVAYQGVGLDKPIALEPGSRFALREGGRTVGSGVVTRVRD